MEKFLNKLRNSNITNLLDLSDNADPNLNFIFIYETLHEFKTGMFSKEAGLL